MNDDDNIYLTVNITSTDLRASFPVVYNSNIAFPIVDNLDNYMVGIDSATIPTDNLPLFWPLIQPYPNINDLLTQYSFTMEYNGTFSDEIFAIFVTQNPQRSFIPLSQSLKTADYDSGFYNVYTVGPILEMLNTTIENAFIDLSTKIILPVGAVPPYFTYDYDNEKFELNSQLSYYDNSTLPIPIRIYSNYTMFTLVDKIDYIYYVNNPNNLRFFYNISSNNDNVYLRQQSFPPIPPTPDDYYIRMIQEISTIGNFTPVKSICITSNNLPIKADYLPQTKSIYNNNNESLLGEEVIVAEFEPIIRFSPTIIGQEFQYRPEYRRLKNMKSKLSLQKINIDVYWRDIYGGLHQVISNINKVTTVRLIFCKKNKEYKK